MITTQKSSNLYFENLEITASKDVNVQSSNINVIQDLVINAASFNVNDAYNADKKTSIHTDISPDYGNIAKGTAITGFIAGTATVAGE